MVRFVPIFYAGAILWLYRSMVPDSRLLLSASIGVFVVGTFLRNSDVLSGPPLAYISVWAGAHLPGKSIGAKYDISYRTYVYAFVVGQVLAIRHLYHWGYAPFTLLTVALTLVIASGSRICVERPALRLKRWTPGRFGAPSEPVPKAALGE
jgi:peptidoglycan/LPS O-acetylase OafA/YrhL